MIKYEKYCIHDYVNVTNLDACILDAFIRNIL